MFTVFGCKNKQTYIYEKKYEILQYLFSGVQFMMSTDGVH